MLFNSISFIFILLPISLIGFFALGRLHHRLSGAWLCFISLVFYAWLGWQFLPILILSILFNFTLGWFIQKYIDRPHISAGLLLAGILLNLSALFYFKYMYDIIAFAHESGVLLNSSMAGMILPLGISFFTFTQIGFLVDSKSGVTKEHGFLDYVLFVTFFPHINAGPILHHKEIMPQFAKPETYKFKNENFVVGLSIFSIGLSKKVLVADQFMPIVANAFNNAHDLTRIEAWCGALAYFFQLYFDFSGYSEMALGVARMFNVRFPANFDAPYRATNIIEFWQRWHMSLTRYLTLYLYNPVAMAIVRRRAARGLPINSAASKQAGGFLSMVTFPTLLTMTLAGVWHGSGVTFLIFGALHGIYLTTNHAWRVLFSRPKKGSQTPTQQWLGLMWKAPLTMLAVIVAEVIFRSPTLDVALSMLKAMTFAPAVANNHASELGPIENILGLIHWQAIRDFNSSLLALKAGGLLTILCGFFVIWCMPNVLQLFAAYGPAIVKTRAQTPVINFVWKPTLLWAIALSLTASLAILSVTGTTEFLYFRF